MSTKIRLKKISLNYLIPRIIEAYHLKGADYIDIIATIHEDKPSTIKLEILDEYLEGEGDDLEDSSESPDSSQIDDYESLI